MPTDERYAAFVAAMLAEGQRPNGIWAAFADALYEAVRQDWRQTSFGTWVPAIVVVCPLDGMRSYLEDAPDGKCWMPGHNQPLVTLPEWEARQRTLPVAVEEAVS